MERSDWETNWDPLGLGEVDKLFREYPGRWWIAGGWAIDLFAGKPYRDHADVDILILRSELGAVHEILAGWEIYACQYPGFEPLRLWHKGETLPDVVHDIWCRPGPNVPWAFQFMVMEDDGERWRFRRDNRVTGLLVDLTMVTDGRPLLAPEVQLLFKSKTPRPKDQRDFDRALPLLNALRRHRLIENLQTTDPENPWLEPLRARHVNQQ